MATIAGIGVQLAYEQRGAGTPVLLIHGLASDRHGFERELETLAPHARAIAYDRRGYGDSGAPDVYEATTAEEQGEDAAALLRGLGVARAVVCGDGFGALVALDLLRRHHDLVAAAVLSDPPLYAFVPAATEALGKQHEALVRALARGGPEAAVEAWLAGRFEGEALRRACAAHRAFFADYAGLSTLSIARGELRAITVPVAVVTGPVSPAVVNAAADAIAALVPDVRRERDGDLAGAVLGLLGSV